MGSLNEIRCLLFPYFCMSPAGMCFSAYPCAGLVTFAFSMAALAEVQCYTITYFIKYDRASAGHWSSKKSWGMLTAAERP